MGMRRGAAPFGVCSGTNAGTRATCHAVRYTHARADADISSDVDADTDSDANTPALAGIRFFCGCRGHAVCTRFVPIWVPFADAFRRCSL